MLFCDIYKIFCSATSTISLLLNVVLVFMVLKRGTQIGFYRYFTYCFILVDLLYSHSYVASLPFWYAGPGIVGFFSISSWKNFEMIRASTNVAFQAWFFSFILVLLLITCSFVYRCGLLCSPFIVSLFEVPQRFVATLIPLSAFGSFWLYVSNYVLFQESASVRRILQSKFGYEYGIDLIHGYALVIDINDTATKYLCMAGSLICSTIMQIEIVIIVRTPCITLESIETCVMSLFSQCFCGWNIHKTIIQRQMSNKLKSMHARALKLLISQALNPLFFIYIPSFVILFGMFVDADFGDIPKGLAMCLALFPIVDPVIIIYFTDDYKRVIHGLTSNSRNNRTGQVSLSLSRSIENRP